MTNYLQTVTGAVGFMKSAVRALHVVVFLTLSGLFLALPSMAEAQDYRFSSFNVSGNQRIESTAILNYAGIERGQTISAGGLNEAYQRILASGLFESAELTPRGNRLDIKVVEYPTVNRISFEGNKRLKDEALQSLIESRSRRVLNPNVAERDAARIAEAYSQDGRLAARVTPRIIRQSDNRADLVFEIFEGALTEIERIGFVGNREYSDRRLRRVLESKQAGILRALIKRDTLVEDRIEFDKQVLRDFYLSRGYVDFRTTGVNAELARDRNGYFVTFNVEEGQQFKFGEISAVSEIAAIDAEEYLAALKVKPGVVYSPLVIESSIARLERLALRQGHDFVRVDPRITRDERNLELDVEFAIVRGPRVFVERIDVQGNTTTLDRVIRQQFRIAEGDPFNAREIRESAERIRALDFFAAADVNAREGSESDQVVVDVNVIEKPTGALKFGGTYSTDNGVGAVVNFSERNFLGRGQLLGISFSTASEFKDYSFTFVEPAFLGRDLALGFQAIYKQNEPDVARWANTIGVIEPSLAFPVSENGRLKLNYRLRNIEMELEDASVLTTSLINGEAGAGDSWESSLGYLYTYDTRGIGLDPNSGVLLELGQDFAVLGGDYQFVRTTARVAAETKVFHEEVTLRASLRLGALNSTSGSSRIGNRFQMGSSVMRGFEPLGIGPREIDLPTQDDGLGGHYYAVASLEADFPLGLPEEYKVRGGLFYDVGSLWGLDTSSADVVGEDMSLRHVVGVSLFWETPMGPLRFDFSKALKKETYDKEQNFNFTISTEF
ncbi:MAG: outer membrane protein assembly factor BamA [Rhodobacteraceae bacterium]|nr:outer membrane protein assembly factor BamA [Paracoccaceae bacterium]MCW9042942.1 outer membrane protein assembly factor BamA [Pseudopelagicola sp.]